MRKNILPGGLTVLLLACAATGEAAKKSDERIELFTTPPTSEGQGVWTAYGEQPQTGASRIWQLRDGVLVLKAGPKGYVRTNGDFTNFVLTLQWRRPAGQKPGRGGVLIRMTGKDAIWPKSLEAQLNAGGAGDFWGLIDYRLTGPRDRLKQVRHDQFGLLTNLKKTEEAEKPAGQWNRYEILADGETVTLKINGRVVNRATGCDVVAGKICLTAEGDEIHFRNVRLTPIRSQSP